MWWSLLPWPLLSNVGTTGARTRTRTRTRTRSWTISASLWPFLFIFWFSTFFWYPILRFWFRSIPMFSFSFLLTFFRFSFHWSIALFCRFRSTLQIFLFHLTYNIFHFQWIIHNILSGFHLFLLNCIQRILMEQYELFTTSICCLFLKDMFILFLLFLGCLFHTC